MADNTSAPQKAKWWKRLFKWGMKSPVNFFFGIVFIYCALQAFVFDTSVHSKIVLFAVVCLWAFWFVAKQVFAVLIVLGLLCSGGYLYYEYSHKEIKKCEASGGYWNKETKKCEAKVPLLEQTKRWIKQFMSDAKKEISNEQKVKNEEQK